MLSHVLLVLRRRIGRFGGRRRIEVCPPAVLAAPAPSATAWRFGLREWLSTGWSAPSRATAGSQPQALDAGAAAEARIGRVRDEFLQALDDLHPQQASTLQGRIRIARSLRDLWHLRPEVFRQVALQFSQAEAQRRLDRLNRHFPTRSPRSGFGPLDARRAGQRPDRGG